MRVGISNTNILTVFPGGLFLATFPTHLPKDKIFSIKKHLTWRSGSPRAWQPPCTCPRSWWSSGPAPGHYKDKHFSILIFYLSIILRVQLLHFHNLSKGALSKSCQYLILKYKRNYILHSSHVCFMRCRRRKQV